MKSIKEVYKDNIQRYTKTIFKEKKIIQRRLHEETHQRNIQNIHSKQYRRKQWTYWMNQCLWIVDMKQQRLNDYVNMTAWHNWIVKTSLRFKRKSNEGTIRDAAWTLIQEKTIEPAFMPCTWTWKEQHEKLFWTYFEREVKRRADTQYFEYPG